MTFSKEFWEEKWLSKSTGWDIGYASPALTHFIDRLEYRQLKILIPGCGNAYEAEYLNQNGFTDITLIDIAPEAIKHLNHKFQNNPNIRIIEIDFFDHVEKYDLILEQTFFCALSPVLRSDYVFKMKELLHSSGELAGLLFNRDFDGGPPFGGHIDAYRNLFSQSFDILSMEPTDFSIPERKGSEVFFHCKLKP
ncbi:MAG: TPMT family class I SAM-dependent methyltransferase [Chitinophagales bacterium]|jgi:SAM-dependent methyltransferase|nr:TPMT family class I SAM-dependent methyltransferase [Chitinophagales bacterium]